jgi:hypothetical protein
MLILIIFLIEIPVVEFFLGELAGIFMVCARRLLTAVAVWVFAE